MEFSGKKKITKILYARAGRKNANFRILILVENLFQFRSHVDIRVGSMKMRLFAWCICMLKLIEMSKAWDFTNLGIKGDNVTLVHHISVYYARAFICLKHSRNHNNIQQSMPTLVEASWPENMIGVKPVIFPNEDYFIRRAGKCKGIRQAAVSLS